VFISYMTDELNRPINRLLLAEVGEFTSGSG
jgi:hypothetical protein